MIQLNKEMENKHKNLECEKCLCSTFMTFHVIFVYSNLTHTYNIMMSAFSENDSNF